jgi:Ca2+-binding RTX toxin-like protein
MTTNVTYSDVILSGSTFSHVYAGGVNLEIRGTLTITNFIGNDPHTLTVGEDNDTVLITTLTSTPFNRVFNVLANGGDDVVTIYQLIDSSSLTTNLNLGTGNDSFYTPSTSVSAVNNVFTADGGDGNDSLYLNSTHWNITSYTQSSNGLSISASSNGGTNNTLSAINFEHIFVDNVEVFPNNPSPNSPPVANPDSVSATPNTAINISVATLLANDTDANSDPLTLTGVSNPTGGTAVFNDNGTPSNSADDYITFTATAGFSGNASFDYSISDGKGGTSNATVTVAVGTVQNGTDGNDTLTGNVGNDSINGGNGEDSLTGNAGKDTLIGGNGSDLILGNAGDDLLDGGNGADTLRGGLGNDTLTGGNGSDVFVFAAAEGTDTITDFKLGNDKIGLTGGLTFGQLSFVGSEIRVGSDVLAVLTGVNTTTLTASNFVTV